MPDPAPSSLRKDVVTAYLATGAKVLSWVVVTAVVYRRLGAEYFAVLALVRTTIGLLNYTTLGLAPAMIRYLTAGDPPEPVPRVSDQGFLEYASARVVDRQAVVYSSAVALAAGSFCVGIVLAAAYAEFFNDIHRVPGALAGASHQLRDFVALMGLGTVIRLSSDPAGAFLQSRRRISIDNYLLAAAEVLWVALVVVRVSPFSANGLQEVGVSWLWGGLFLLGGRFIAAQAIAEPAAFQLGAIRIEVIRQLLSFGLLVALAQAADFLYAPTDNILINRFINPETVAVYAPAIQIDAGLLLLVSGLASVLLPHAALAHGAGDARAVRRYYVVGTLASAGMLLIAGVLVWLLSPILFRLWLHDPMTATQAILPLILIHTVVGGSSGVGRSILLAMGKVRPFTTAVLVAGASNVLLSFAFVRFFGLGLKGIVLGTIVAVVGRCAVWMPWYVMRELGRNAE